MSFSAEKLYQADSSSAISGPDLFTLAPSVGVFAKDNIAAESEDTAWAHFMETSCVESESRTSNDPASDFRLEADSTVLGEGFFSYPKAFRIEEDAFERETDASFARNEVANSNHKVASKDEEGKKDANICVHYGEVDLQPSLPCLSNDLKYEIVAPRNEKDRHLFHEFEERNDVQVDSPVEYHSNEKPSNLDFGSESSSLGPHEIPDTASHLTKEERALRRRVFHKVHTRRSRAKLNEKLDHLRLILPTPPPGTSVKSKAQILDWAISCAGRFSSKPLSLGPNAQATPARLPHQTLKDNGRAYKQRGGKGQACISK